MANPYFRFKQFTVYHDQCAMKVCTDACLFGAYTARFLTQHNITPQRVLDAGAGTGLLSLMLAQQSNCPIDAVEIEYADHQQCNENFEQSAWAGRLNATWSDIKKFQTTHRYSLIISNPPFFENDLKPEQPQKQRAKHEHSLSLEALFTETERLLVPDGYFALLLPRHRETEAGMVAKKHGLYPIQIARVCQTPVHNPFRSMLLFQHKQTLPLIENIVIKNEQDEYTAEFIALLKDYYLYL